MHYGYARISREDHQVLSLQMDALNQAGCQKIFSDGFTGFTTDRPGLKRCLKALEYGDHLTVWKLDRLARNVRDLILIMEDFQKRGIHFHSLNELIDTSTAVGKLTFHLFAILAEFERDITIERTRAGLKAARARGVHCGPKFKLSRQQIEHARELIAKGKRTEDTAALLNVSRTTLYRALMKAAA